MSRNSMFARGVVAKMLLRGFNPLMQKVQPNKALTLKGENLIHVICKKLWYSSSFLCRKPSSPRIRLNTSKQEDSCFCPPSNITLIMLIGFRVYIIPIYKSTKARRRRNGTDPDIDFESGAADRPARCPCAGVPAMAGPAHPLVGCLDCSL